ncbi:MAG: hypothetical protein V3U28_00680 [Candidatus Acidoferrales bacterium]
MPGSWLVRLTGLAVSFAILFLAGQILAEDKTVELLATKRVALESGWRTVGVQRDAEGNYYVLNEADGVIWIYDKEFSTQGRIFIGGEAEGRSPRDFAVTREGKIVVADWVGGGRVSVYDHNGSLVSSFPFPRPWSVATLSTGEILIAGFQKGQLVSVVSQEGTPLWTIGSLVPITEEPNRNAFLNVGRLAVDPQDNIYYGFSFLPEATIRKYSRHGDLLAELRPQSERVRQMATMARQKLESENSFGGSMIILALALDESTGSLWVCSAGQIFQIGPDGTTRKVYQFKMAPNRPVGAQGILVENDRLIVTAQRYGVWLAPKPE